MSLFDPNKTGKDNRFHNSHRIGRVSEIVTDEGQTCVRVIYPDKEDLISKPLPVLQGSGGARRSFNVPKVGQSVLVAHLANGEQEGFVEGTFYTTADPPPIWDPKRQYTEFADGTSVDYNEGTNTMTIDAKGPINIVTTGPAVIKAPNITLEGDVLIKGNLKVEGDVENTGNMTTGGTHTDSIGRHDA